MPIRREPPSSADPVGDVLAAAGEVASRFPGEALDLDDLRVIVGVAEIDPKRSGGFNTVVSFADETASYARMEDGIELALAEQPGIEELDHPDREEMLVRTTLSLPDVHAAAVRALLEVNRRPRAMPPIGLPLTVVSDMAQGLIGALDWPGRLRMGRERDDQGSPSSTLDGWHGCWRPAEPGLLQVVHLWYGLGEIGDGVQLEGTITVYLKVWDALETSIREVRGREFPNGTVVAERSLYAVPPTVAHVVGRTRSGLGWFDHVGARQSIVDLWVRQPDGIAPYPLWEKLEVAARWGFPEQARALLRHGHRRQRSHGPKLDDVARRYGL